MDRQERVTRRISAVRELLLRRIRQSDLSQRKVEKRLGWSMGYISQIARGRVRLTFEHYFSILEALEMEPIELDLEFLEATQRAIEPPVDGETAKSPLPPRLEQAVREIVRQELEPFVKLLPVESAPDSD